MPTAASMASLSLVIAMPPPFVIASVANQSRAVLRRPELPRDLRSLAMTI